MQFFPCVIASISKNFFFFSSLPKNNLICVPILRLPCHFFPVWPGKKLSTLFGFLISQLVEHFVSLQKLKVIKKQLI